MADVPASNVVLMLYTYRVRMIPLVISTRGAPWVEMCHHFEFSDDSHALDSLTPLNNNFRDGELSNRWLVVRSSNVHEGAIYRRDITNRKSWTLIKAENFYLDDQLHFELTTKIGDAPVELDFAVAPHFPHTRGAVLVRETAESGPVSRTMYVGPVSPVSIWVTVPELIPSLPLVTGALWIDYPGFGDAVYKPNEDTVDVWREQMTSLVRDHVHGLEAQTHLGIAVVPSWKLENWWPVSKTQASPVRAELRTRSMRRAMGAP
jgi:hypothetical protein